MATQFEEFEFPDEIEAKKTKAAPAEEKFEIEIEDDTPVEDRGRKPMAKPPEDPTEDELNSYDEKVQARIKKFTRGYHDERRACCGITLCCACRSKECSAVKQYFCPKRSFRYSARYSQ